MKRQLIVSTLVIFGHLASIGQTGVIHGSVKHIDSSTALSGASVYLDNKGLGTISNAMGKFTINNVPNGKYTVVVSNIGYQTIKKEVTIKDNKPIELNFNLIESISSLDEVTITGGLLGMRDIPGSVHYISPKEIQKFNYVDINRILRTIPGINVQEEDGFGLFPNIGLRGTGVERNTKITVMEDGILMAPAPYAAPAAYYFPTMGRMQGVEVIKGSSQIKYGPYTTGGAINLISTQIPSGFAGKVNLMGGSFGGRNLHAVVGNSHDNFAYVVETFQYGSNGFKKIDNTNNSGIDRNTGFQKQDYLAKFRINSNPDAKFYQSLSFKMGQSIGNINESYLGLTQDDFNTAPFRRYAGSQVDEINTSQNQFSLTHKIILSNYLSITSTAYRTNFKRNWYKLDRVKNSSGVKTKIGKLLDHPSKYENAYNIITGSTSTLDDALFVKANNRSYYSKGLQTKLSFDFNTNNITHKIDVGLRIHQDQIDRFQWFDEYAMNDGVMQLTKSGEHGTESNRVETADAIATYFQYKLKIGKFTVTPGLRYEHISQTRLDYGKSDPSRTAKNLSERTNIVDILIPGIGLDYSFSKNLSTFVGIHKGFAPPGSKDDLIPEESINYELGTRYSNNGLSGQAVIFFNDYSNLLGSDLEAAGGGGTNEQFNGGSVLTKGLEFNLSYDLLYAANNTTTFSLPIGLIYTYTDAQFLNDFDSDFEGWGEVSAGDQFPYLTNNQFTITLGLEHQKFSFNLSGKYMDEMRTAPGQGEIPINEKISAYFVLDAVASYNLHKNISFYINATNLSNEIYEVARRPAGLRPGMPRAINVGIKAMF